MQRIVPFFSNLLLVLLFAANTGQASEKNPFLCIDGTRPEFDICGDKTTWTMPDEGEINNVVGVYGVARSHEEFNVLYVGKGGTKPQGWRYYFRTPEIVNSPNGQQFKVRIRVGPRLERTYTGIIDWGKS